MINWIKKQMKKLEDKRWSKERQLKYIEKEYDKLLKHKDKFESERRVFGTLVALYNHENDVDLWEDMNWINVKDESLYNEYFFNSDESLLKL